MMKTLLTAGTVATWIASGAAMAQSTLLPTAPPALLQPTPPALLQPTPPSLLQSPPAPRLDGVPTSLPPAQSAGTIQPNGNGTSTLTSPTGRITIVPTPR